MPISSSNNLVRVDYYAALFSLNSTRWHRSESCILKSLGYSNIKKYWPVLKSKPSIVIEKPGGYGFAEFTRWLLERK
ncbi:hypothetical protein [Vibrio caribbeanicus]|uniref:hypothetical protein n=1 Tax=Vibrio caribbeanicus TaxID=701175 RepID=UPI0009D73CA3